MKPRSRFQWVGLLAVLGALAGTGSSGCMEERAAINRVQPNILRKSDVIPVQWQALQSGVTPGRIDANALRREAQWYHQITIVDKPPTTGGGGISSYTQVERIYWEVTENMLFARQAYDRLQGAGDNPTRPGVGQNPRQNEIVAAYRIDSHFDIRNDYNSNTGEPINVVIENTTDRPWYRREFMRVDWSRNLVGTYTPLSSLAWYGRLTAEASDFEITPGDPNAPVFDCGAKSCDDTSRAPGTLTYFDVTNRMILTPDTVDVSGYTALPACLLYDRITESCEPPAVLMRVAFRKVDPNRDYQPQNLDGHRMDRFGFFENARQGFNERLGAPGQLERRHLAERHNLWVLHHARPAGNAALDHRDSDREFACNVDNDCATMSATAKCDTGTHTCGEVYRRCAPTVNTDDADQRQASADMQCAAVGSGAKCDLDIATTRGDRYGLCLLPYRQRQVRPVTYHLSPNYPERMMPVTRSIASQWNDVFVHAVHEARYRECLLDPAGGGASACARWRDSNAEGNRDSKNVWVTCHNPVWGTDRAKAGYHSQAEVNTARAAGWDLESCGPQGTSARLGDIRYNMIASVNEYDAQGPWGLANITGDPVTGEVVSARGAVWQTVTDSQAAFATDMIKLLNNEATEQDISLGRTILDAYDALIRGQGGREPATTPRRASTLAPRAVHQDYQSAEEIQTVLNQTRLDHLQTVATDAERTLTPEQIRQLSNDGFGRRNEQALVRNLLTMYAPQLPSNSAVENSQTRLALLRGTSIERALVDQELLRGANFDPTGLSPEAMEAASPFRNNNVYFRALREQMHTAMQEHECRYDAAFADDVIAVMLYRFRRNEVPEDVRFGQTWNFHQGSPAACPDALPTDGTTDCPLNYAEVERYLQQFVHYGVMLHELGHSVGERHNFSGSTDATNYPDRYWQLRRTAGAAPNTPTPDATAIRPRWEHMARGLPFYSQAEQAGGVEEYAYSSVMDYVGWNQDAHGLGRYDRAFVLHGYVNMVEAFDRMDEPDEFLMAYENWSGGYQSAFRIFFQSAPGGVVPKTYHYTDIPRLVGLNAQGNPNIGDDNRYPVFVSETAKVPYGAFGWTPDHSNVANANRDGSRATEAHALVPYMFNTDNYANYIWNTQRYDGGADMFESMRYVSQHYYDYYFTTAFARNRATFTTAGYRSRITGRYMDQAYYSMRNLVYLSSIYQNAYANVPGFAQLFDTPSIAGGRLGAAMITDMFINALLMPEANPLAEDGTQHCVRRRTDGTEMFDRVNAQTACINVPLGQGRPFSSYFDFGSGSFWRDRVVNAGAYHDKQLSLDYMTATFNWIPGRYLIEWQDVHPLQINFYTLYPGPTMRFFGSLLSRDHDDIGIQVERGAGNVPRFYRTQYARLNLPWGSAMNTNGRDHGVAARAIDPNVGFTLEMEALAFLRTQLELTFDRSARVSALLWREGDHWGLPATQSRTLVSFTNPFTNITYFAVHLGGRAGEPGADVGLSRRDTMSNETGIAARMLVEAERLATAWRAATGARRTEIQNELRGYIDLIDRARDVSHAVN